MSDNNKASEHTDNIDNIDNIDNTDNTDNTDNIDNIDNIDGMDEMDENTEKKIVEDTASEREANHEGSMKETIAELVDKAKNIISSKDAIEKAEAKRMRNDWLLAKAETENVRRRSQREISDARKYAIEPFAKELLSVADNLQRALDAAAGDKTDVTTLRQGVQLTLNNFATSMEKFGVQRINAVGETFNPQLHEALAQVPHDEIVEDCVVMQHAAGYTLHGRLLRPASVIVSSGKLAATNEDTQAEKT